MNQKGCQCRVCGMSGRRYLSTSKIAGSTQIKVENRLTTQDIRNKEGFIIDMDGVIYHGKKVLPGALLFVSWLQENGKKFMFLTNSSERSPRELQEKLHRLGIQVSADHFYTSALATARFLAKQKPNGSAYVIGEPGLTSALYEAGFSMNDSNPDYVVVGETRNYSYDKLETAVDLLRRGARLIGTNCDLTDRMDDSFIPACGSLIKPLELASGRAAYFVGKPNPLIMRAALTKLGIRREDAVIIGDRMDTDILAGVESEIRTVLLLSGVTHLADLNQFAYQPDCILPTVGHILQDYDPSNTLTSHLPSSATPTLSATSTLASSTLSKNKTKI